MSVTINALKQQVKDYNKEEEEEEEEEEKEIIFKRTDLAVEITDGCFRWDLDQSDVVLKDINFRAKHGESEVQQLLDIIICVCLSVCVCMCMCVCLCVRVCLCVCL